MHGLANNNAGGKDHRKAEVRKWEAFALNVLFGFGIGSYAQGDILGGVIGTVGEVGGICLFCVPYVRFAVSDVQLTESEAKGMLLMMMGGFAVLLGTRIFEFIRPFTFASKMEELNVAMAPSFDLNGNVGLTRAVNLKFQMNYNKVRPNDT
ncbi:MAG: P13 family porin [Treponema sp.]|nr:P13 family porin [Treponema sp.]